MSYDLSTLKVVDDVLPNASAVRNSALATGFGSWKPNPGSIGSTEYTGVSFQGDHPACIRAVQAAMGQPIIPGSMHFRVTNRDSERALVHSDIGYAEYTALIYLSEMNLEYGTKFYRHKQSGYIRLPKVEDLVKRPDYHMFRDDMSTSDPSKWTEEHYVQAKYNRLVLFDAGRFHCRTGAENFGNTDVTARMIWACHFYLK